MSLKKLTLALFVSVAMLGAAPVTMAKPAGKIENATPAETVVAIDETVAIAEEALKAVQEGTLEKKEMMALFKRVKQKAKTIESTVTYSIRERALGRLGKARLAYKKGKEQSEVVEKMTHSLKTFKELRERYHNFDGS